jgi:3-methyladenine DNA glycosylase AlkD
MTSRPSRTAGKMRPASSLEEPAPGGDEGCVAPPTATGVAGGVAPPLAVGDGFEDWPVVDVALGRGDAGREVGGATLVGRGVGRTVGMGRGVVGTVTVMTPPGADVPSEPMNVTVQVPGEATRADLVQVDPPAGALIAMDTVVGPRVRRAVTEPGAGLPESTRKANSVLVVPVLGLTDPLLRPFLATVGLRAARSATAASSKAIPELRMARGLGARAMGAVAAKRDGSSGIRARESWCPAPRATIALMAGAVTRLAAEIEANLRVAGTPERAAQEKRYLKSDLQFLGASVWEIRRAVKAVVDRESLDHDHVVALVRELWSEPIHERRMAAVAALELRASELGAADLGLVEELLRDSRTWALVDGLAADVAGSIAERDPAGASSVLDRWAADADFWVRRAALLGELKPLRSGAPFDRFAAHADAMLDEREFFIRKAIGWVLRETGKRRAPEVIGWLATRTGRASGVTMREATRYLPEPDACRLMTAYRARRPAL